MRFFFRFMNYRTVRIYVNIWNAICADPGQLAIHRGGPGLLQRLRWVKEPTTSRNPLTQTDELFNSKGLSSVVYSVMQVRFGHVHTASIV